MKTALLLFLPALLVLAGCGSSEKDAGAKACRIYQDAVSDAPEAVASTTALAEIKRMLSDLDDPTRRAFSGLITAADSDFLSPAGAPETIDEKAAAVRSVCLSEHSVEIAD